MSRREPLRLRGEIDEKRGGGGSRKCKGIFIKTAARISAVHKNLARLWRRNFSIHPR